MGKMTFVIEYEDGKEPPVSADMNVAGGRLVAASWHDYRDDFFSPEQRDIIVSCIEDAEWHGQLEADEAACVLNAAELLTY